MRIQGDWGIEHASQVVPLLPGGEPMATPCIAVILMLLPAYDASMIILLQASGEHISCPRPAQGLGIVWNSLGLAAGVRIAGLYIWAPEASHAAAMQQLCRILLGMRTSELLTGEQPPQRLA